MLSLFILFINIMFKAEARGPYIDPVVITFKIHAEVDNTGHVNMICENDENSRTPSYTVLEGEEFHIYTKYDSNINDVICEDYDLGNVFKPYMEKKIGSKDKTIFQAERTMYGMWNCTVLLHRDDPSSKFPKVQYKNANYTAAYCIMRIHVRLRKSPQTILVNNMELQTVRTDVSEDVDFIAEYQYADGDAVDVTCADFLNDDRLEMQLSMEGTITDKLHIFKVVGFIANLHSGHNNSYMLCKTVTGDATTVMVRFVMRTEFNIISVRINGMTIRPLKIAENYYNIKYKYESLHSMNVVCEVQQTDLALAVTDDAFNFDKSYNKTELIPRKKAEMSFYPKGPHYNMILSCDVSNYITGANAERIKIDFTPGNFPLKYVGVVLHITSNGTAMDSYISDGKFKVVYYEYNDGEILEFKCGPLFLPLYATPYNVSLNFGDSDACNTHGCVLYKTIKVSRLDHNIQITCYLSKAYGVAYGETERSDLFELSEITVILRMRFQSTPSTTTTTTTPSHVNALTTAISTISTASDPPSTATTTSNTILYCGAATGVAVIAILVVGGYWTVKKRCCSVRSTSQELPPIPTPRPDPASVYYQNLLSVFKPINEREAMEMENVYEEVE